MQSFILNQEDEAERANAINKKIISHLILIQVLKINYIKFFLLCHKKK